MNLHKFPLALQTQSLAGAGRRLLLPQKPWVSHIRRHNHSDVNPLRANIKLKLTEHLMLHMLSVPLCAFVADQSLKIQFTFSFDKALNMRVGAHEKEEMRGDEGVNPDTSFDLKLVFRG